MSRGVHQGVISWVVVPSSLGVQLQLVSLIKRRKIRFVEHDTLVLWVLICCC